MKTETHLLSAKSNALLFFFFLHRFENFVFVLSAQIHPQYINLPLPLKIISFFFRPSPLEKSPLICRLEKSSHLPGWVQTSTLTISEFTLILRTQLYTMPFFFFPCRRETNFTRQIDQ